MLSRKTVNMNERMPEGLWYCATGAVLGFVGVGVLAALGGIGPFIGTYLALGGGLGGLVGGGAISSKIDALKERKNNKKEVEK